MLSMQEWQGCQHPRSALFAAFTIASQRSVVMSPCHRAIFGLAFTDGRAFASTIPLSRMTSDKYASCTLRKSSEAGYGGRRLNSERRSLRCCISSSGIEMSAYWGISRCISRIR